MHEASRSTLNCKTIADCCHVTLVAIVMTVRGQTCDDDESLPKVIRLEKVSDQHIDLDAKHVVHGGPFDGVVVRQPINGERYYLFKYSILYFLHKMCTVYNFV